MFDKEIDIATSKLCVVPLLEKFQAHRKNSTFAASSCVKDQELHFTKEQVCVCYRNWIDVSQAISELLVPFVLDALCLKLLSWIPLRAFVDRTLTSACVFDSNRVKIRGRRLEVLFSNRRKLSNFALHSTHEAAR